MISKSKTNGKALLPGVAYIRMSSDQQEASPDQQRAEVAKLAERHGYKIIREYFDSGISGAATSKRKDFLRMMHDAEHKADFKAILCWDQDRFGRFDSIEAGRWVHPLRERGIQLVTVAQGVIDWSDFAGRMIYSIHQEGKAQYLQDLSRNVVRGLIASAKAGNGVNKPPYGFDRLFYDQSGKLVQRVPYGQSFRRPKGWSCKLAISEDSKAVETVRWLFETFATTDCSAQALAFGLNKQGKRTSSGVAWRHDVILDMLRNPMYAGTYAYGRHRCGKFHHIGTDGSATPSKSPKRIEREPIVVIEDNHDAIVSKETFERVQRKLAQRSFERRAPGIRSYRLSGLLVCGHCGGRMVGHTNRNGTSSKPYFYYYCTNGAKGTCGFRKVRADQLENLLAEFVADTLLAPEALKQMEAELRRQFSSKGKASPAKVKDLRARLAKLEAQVAKGGRNLLLADDDDVPALKQVLAEWKQERDALKVELASLEAAGSRKSGSPDELVKKAVAELERLGERISATDGATAREAFRTLFEQVTIYWHKRAPSQKRHRIARIVIEAKSAMSFSGASAQYAPKKSHTIEYADKAEIPAESRETAAAVAKLANGRPADVRDVMRELGLKSRGAATSRLVKAHNRGLIQKAGRYAWAPIGWTGPKEDTPIHKRKPR